jgi:hypothetical protein
VIALWIVATVVIVVGVFSIADEIERAWRKRWRERLWRR